VQNADPDLVVILSPLHQPYPGSLLTSSHSAYQTPLGSIPLDTDKLGKLQSLLRDNHSLELGKISNDQEHSIEILLPFLQRSLQPGFKILPVMIRDQRPETMKALSAALTNLMEGINHLLIASTDLSHFHPAEEAELLDRTIIDGITALDPASMYRAEAEGRGSACGLGGLAAVIWTARKLGANRGLHLKYAHSGHTSGDFSRVVGYEAAALVQE
jgi:AmmeMemoRadiSam system protein B